MSSENRESHAMVSGAQDENCAAQDQFPFKRASEEIDRVIKEIKQVTSQVENELMDARIAGKYRAQMRTSLEKQTLYDKGIESVKDWNEYIATTERDGELIADLCDMFQTGGDAGHLRGVLSAIQPSRALARRQVESKPSEEKMDTEESNGQSRNMIVRSQGAPNEEVIQVEPRENSTERRQTGAYYEPHSRLHSVISSERAAIPGFDDQTLLDIMVDDHLEGRAKSVLLALPNSVRERGFEAVVEEVRKMLTQDSTAGRLRALAELRCLRRRPGQSVADFCSVLEHLGRQANPSCSIKDRSLEYAQILLDNLTDWPEHIQLLSTLHGVSPSEAYDSVKQLALTMEQSKSMWASSGSTRRDGWKRRSMAYQQAERKRELEPKGVEGRVQHDSRKRFAPYTYAE
ncbi:hypothetical protein OSTOST_06102 [Ostertagia ostertagi]